MSFFSKVCFFFVCLLNKLNTILNKYCKFLPVEIKFGTKTEKIDDPQGKKDEKGNIVKIDN